MNDIKTKLPLILGIIIFIVICGISYYYIFEKDYIYYTQIDNNKIKEITPDGGMKYEYNLTMYEEIGISKDIKFKTSRELRESAFLKVKYYPISGVNKWEEVQYNELPDKVKEIYKNS